MKKKILEKSIRQIILILGFAQESPMKEIQKQTNVKCPNSDIRAKFMCYTGNYLNRIF